MKRQVPRLEGAAKTVAKGELVGLRCRISGANDAGIIGLEGEVIGETLHTIELRTNGRRIILAKRGTEFSFATKSDWVKVNGAAIEFRPQDRLKKVR